MKLSKKAIALIKQYEGLKLSLYEDAGGKATIGYGHLVRPGEDFSQAIEESRAEQLLIEDATAAEAAVNQLIGRPLRQGEFDALTSFVFNVGAEQFRLSTLRRKVQEGEDLAAAREFLRWIYADGVALKGLFRRRLAEAQLYLLDD